MLNIWISTFPVNPVCNEITSTMQMQTSTLEFYKFKLLIKNNLDIRREIYVTHLFNNIPVFFILLIYCSLVFVFFFHQFTLQKKH